MNWFITAFGPQLLNQPQLDSSAIQDDSQRAQHILDHINGRIPKIRQYIQYLQSFNNNPTTQQKINLLQQQLNQHLTTKANLEQQVNYMSNLNQVNQQRQFQYPVDDKFDQSIAAWEHMTSGRPLNPFLGWSKKDPHNPSQRIQLS